MLRVFRTRHVVVVVLSLVIAAFLFWVVSESRPPGILSGVGDALGFLFLLAYFIALMFGPNAHEPSAVAFFIVLFLEVYALVSVASLIFQSSKQKPAPRE